MLIRKQQGLQVCGGIGISLGIVSVGMQIGELWYDNNLCELAWWRIQEGSTKKEDEWSWNMQGQKMETQLQVGEGEQCGSVLPSLTTT